MFFRKVTSKSNDKEYTYVKLIENYREGHKVKQRVIANLGNIEDLTPEKVQGLVSGLTRICGMDTDPRDSFETQKVLHFGEVLATSKVWELLGMRRMIQELLPREKSGTTPLLTELLVMNQVIKPKSRKSVSPWYRCLYMPQLEGRFLTEEDFSGAVDAIVSIKEPLEKRLFWAIQRIFPAKTGTIYCHLTRGFFEQPVSDDKNISGRRSFIARSPDKKQVDMGILVNEKGIPFGHRMFTGHFADGDTVPRRVSQIQQQYSVSQCVFVTDQRVVSEENLRLLVAYGYQYIAGLEIRFNRNLDGIEKIINMPAEAYTTLNNSLQYKEIRAGESRYMLCYNPEKASERIFVLESRLNAIENELKEIQQWVAEGCSLNAKSNYYRANNLLKDTFCRRYFECMYDERSGSFSYRRKKEVIDREISSCGKFILKTNAFSLPPEEIINAYLNYSEAKEEFRVIKNNNAACNLSESRLRGYVFISVLAYLVEKVLENMLLKNNIEINARTALEILEDIKLTINKVHSKEVRFITPAYGIQKEVLSALGVVDVPRTLAKGVVL